MDDPFHLQRFVDAQAPVWDDVCAELRAGTKRSHWMWFVFPQLAALGRSATAKFYGLAGLDEAQAYVAHPVLGPRLAVTTALVLAQRGRSLQQIFGSPDDLKFCSCMTLFERVAADPAPFAQALHQCCDGRRDRQTLALLAP